MMGLTPGSPSNICTLRLNVHNKMQANQCAQVVRALIKESREVGTGALSHVLHQMFLNAL